MRLLLIAMMAIGGGAACSDPCSLVVGCSERDRVAVEGRVLTQEGRPVEGTKVTLYVKRAGNTDSAQAVTGNDGVFSLAIPADTASAPLVSLHVKPLEAPGYTLENIDCEPVYRWGDACVLNPVLMVPNFPIFHFYYRNDETRPAANVRVTFRRTGGAELVGPQAAAEHSMTTDANGIGMLFPPRAWAGAMEPVIGDLIVDLPPPLGPTVRHNYAIRPNAFFTSHPIAVQLTGPSLSYAMHFSDSATGASVAGATLAFQRASGIPTQPASFTSASGADGWAYFHLAPLAMGSVVGDLTIRASAGGPAKEWKALTLETFDADLSTVLARWRVGATGILYAEPATPP